MILNSILDILGSSAIFPPIMSLLVGGGATIFRNWIFSEEDFRNKVDIEKQRIISKFAKNQNKMLHHALFSQDHWDTPSETITDCSDEYIRLNIIFFKIDNLRKRVSLLFSLLLITIFISFFGIIIAALPIKTVHVFISVFFYIMIILQAITVFKIRKVRESLEDYSQSI